MSDLISTLVRELGASTGTMILFMGLAISLLYQRQVRHGQRFNGLIMMLRDEASPYTFEKMLRYGAIDDPRHVATLKELLA